MILKWIKWKFFIRIKEQYKNTRINFIKNNYKYIISLAVIKKLAELIFIYLINFFIVARVLKSNISIYLNFLALYLILVSFGKGILSSNNYFTSIDKKWLKSNVLSSDTMIKILVFSENIFFRSYDIVIILFGCMFPIYLSTSGNYLIISLKCTFLLLFYFINTFITANLHAVYLSSKEKFIHPYFKLILSIILKGTICIVTYIFASKIYPLINNIFLMINKNDIKYFDKIKYNLMYLFNNKVINFVKHDWFELTNLMYLLIFYVFITLFIIIILKLMQYYKVYYGTKKSYLFFIEKLFIYLDTKNLIKDKIFLMYIQIFLRNIYTLRNISCLTGNLGYWIYIGFMSGLILNNKNSIFYYTLLSMMIFMPIYRLGNYIFEKLAPSISFESDGKKVYLQLLSKENLWDIVNRKIKLFLIVLIPIIFTGDLVMFFITKINFLNFIILFLMHSIVIVCCTHIYYLPSMIAPHFDFTDIQQINMYKDKEIVFELLNGFVHLILNPLILIPTVFFVTNKINFMYFCILQILLVVSTCALCIFVIRFSLKKKLLCLKKIELNL